MNKTVKNIFSGLLLVLGTVLIGYFIYKTNTKSYSPEDTVVYNSGKLELEVFYNRPYKKGRQIFGGLVPYNEVWRTGANEATTFTTNKDILLDGSLLAAGTYTLWTIPMEDSWKVIFNSQMYPWGITADKRPARLPEFDVLTVQVPVHQLEQPIEQFTIDFEEQHDFIIMNLLWDQTLVKVPIMDPQKVERIRTS